MPYIGRKTGSKRGFFSARRRNMRYTKMPTSRTIYICFEENISAENTTEKSAISRVINDINRNYDKV